MSFLELLELILVEVLKQLDPIVFFAPFVSIGLGLIGFGLAWRNQRWAGVWWHLALVVGYIVMAFFLAFIVANTVTYFGGQPGPARDAILLLYTIIALVAWRPLCGKGAKETLTRNKALITGGLALAVAMFGVYTVITVANVQEQQRAWDKEVCVDAWQAQRSGRYRGYGDLAVKNDLTITNCHEKYGVEIFKP